MSLTTPKAMEPVKFQSKAGQQNSIRCRFGPPTPSIIFVFLLQVFLLHQFQQVRRSKEQGGQHGQDVLQESTGGGGASRPMRNSTINEEESSTRGCEDRLLSIGGLGGDEQGWMQMRAVVVEEGAVKLREYDGRPDRSSDSSWTRLLLLENTALFGGKGGKGEEEEREKRNEVLTTRFAGGSAGCRGEDSLTAKLLLVLWGSRSKWSQRPRLNPGQLTANPPSRTADAVSVARSSMDSPASTLPYKHRP
ncbi:hypothetical protein BJ546DRAFT_956701 [Cryomyces antarcticus]